MKPFLFVLFLAQAGAGSSAVPDGKTIVSRSVAANEADFRAASQYSHFERDRDSGGVKTYRVLMIDGSPYQQLMTVNGKQLPPERQREEERKLKEETAKRHNQTEQERRERIANYERDRKRDHEMMEQLTQAFEFHYDGQRTMAGHRCYVLAATPKPGYKPPDRDSQALTGMKGRMWIDTQTYQWVKVEAHVFRPVSISGFLARVEPGTRFELENMPVDSGVWLPKHFAMRSNARILGLFSRKGYQDQTFFNYRKSTPADSAAGR